MLMDILYSIVIKPIQLFFEIVYAIANRVMGNPGWSIVALSLIMNLLVLPMYMRADKLQEEQGKKEELMRPGIEHIKRTFSGDERLMMLQAFYRYNRYKPIDSLKGSLSLLLQIPFFIAAYQFLSHLTVLEMFSFGPVSDLSKPDALISIGSITLNLLPFIMTGLNLISCSLFTKGQSLKSKVQLYAMALFFLVFLYQSPSGLVFYWTLNNVFSLVKTIFYKIKDPKKVIAIISFIFGVMFIVFGLLIYDHSETRRRLLLTAVGVLLLSPLVLRGLRKAGRDLSFGSAIYVAGKGITAEGIFLTLLLGCVIPSAVVASSPLEFMNIKSSFNPAMYIISPTLVAGGLFVLWMEIFYRISNEKLKAVFSYGMWCLCGISIANYMLFGTEFGILSSSLKYEKDFEYSVVQVLTNMLLIAAIVFVFIIIRNRLFNFSKWVIYAGIPVLAIMTIINISNVNKVYVRYSADKEKNAGEFPEFSMSRKGKNVVFIMLDRGMDEYIPYLFKEKPELKEKFDGFTWYSNMLSFCHYTNVAAPPLFGGYEYTPVEMNKRSNENYSKKYNEAIGLIPVIFNDNGYRVTLCDAPVWAGDYSFFGDYPDIRLLIADGYFTSDEIFNKQVKENERNFFCYSLMKTAPVFLQKSLYNSGYYNVNDLGSSTNQDIIGTSIAHGMSITFMNAYNVLCNLPGMTKIVDSEENTFFEITNSTTHDPVLLKEPEYIPADNVDNTEFDENNKDRFTIDGVELIMESGEQAKHYQSNMAAMIKISEWLDYLKKEGVYDNTRIIIAADHGRYLQHIQDMISDMGVYEYFEKKGLPEKDMENLARVVDLESFYPLLMVKDFDSHGFTTSEDFMTNADVPSMIFKDLIDDPKNPFTGKEINDAEKMAHDQYVYATYDITVGRNGDFYTLPPNIYYSVHDDVRDKNNWSVVTYYGAPDNYQGSY